VRSQKCEKCETQEFKYPYPLFSLLYPQNILFSALCGSYLRPSRLKPLFDFVPPLCSQLFSVKSVSKAFHNSLTSEWHGHGSPTVWKCHQTRAERNLRINPAYAFMSTFSPGQNWWWKLSLTRLIKRDRDEMHRERERERMPFSARNIVRVYY